MEEPMRFLWALVGVGVLLLAIMVGSSHWSRADARRKAEAPADPALVKRGDYLVNKVAHCGECHTPRNNRGQLDYSRHLQGAPMWFRPKIKVGEFEDRAPNITAGGKAGKWSAAKMTKFLSSGGEDGEKPDPPMPAYKLSVEDARAVTAYLRSLDGGGKRKKAKRKDDDDDD
jgi:mono/diheme cytochrome c family protein